MFILTSLLLMIIGIIYIILKGIGIQTRQNRFEKYNKKQIEWYSIHQDKWVPYLPKFKISKTGAEVFKVKTHGHEYYEVIMGEEWNGKLQKEIGQLGTYVTLKERREIGIINNKGMKLIGEGQIRKAEEECVKQELGKEIYDQWFKNRLDHPGKYYHYWK